MSKQDLPESSVPCSLPHDKFGLKARQEYAKYERNKKHMRDFARSYLFEQILKSFLILFEECLKFRDQFA